MTSYRKKRNIYAEGGGTDTQTQSSDGARKGSGASGAIGAGLSALGGITGILDTSLQLATPKDSSRYAAQVSDMGLTRMQAYSSYDDLAQGFASNNSTLNIKDGSLGPSGGEIAKGVGSSALAGAAAGAQIGGPWGAAIGAVVGGGSALAGGLIGKRKGEEREFQLEQEAEAQRQLNANYLSTQTENMKDRSFGGLYANVAAEGGGIHIRKENRGTFTEAAKRRHMTVRQFADRVLAKKNADRYTTAMKRKANFARNAAGWSHADGGPLEADSILTGDYSTHGGWYAPPLTRINAGGTHEENPYGGVQMGVDAQGTPNLVEQGETVYDDYVFSDRLKPTKADLKAFLIPEKYAGRTFAKISEALGAEADSRPDDPISNNGLGAMLDRLTACQDDFKARQEEKRLRAELAKMDPESLVALGAQLAQAQGMPQSYPQEEAAMQPDVQDPYAMQGQEAAYGEPVQQMPAAQAYGGSLYGGGGGLAMALDSAAELFPKVWDRVAEYNAQKRCGGRLFAAGGYADTDGDDVNSDGMPEYDTGLPVYSAQSVLEPAVVVADDPKRLAFQRMIAEGRDNFLRNAVSVANTATGGFIPVMSLADAVANGDGGDVAREAAWAAAAAAVPGGGAVREGVKAERKLYGAAAKKHAAKVERELAAKEVEASRRNAADAVKGMDRPGFLRRTGQAFWPKGLGRKASDAWQKGRRTYNELKDEADEIASTNRKLRADRKDALKRLDETLKKKADTGKDAGAAARNMELAKEIDKAVADMQNADTALKTRRHVLLPRVKQVGSSAIAPAKWAGSVAGSLTLPAVAGRALAGFAKGILSDKEKKLERDVDKVRRNDFVSTLSDESDVKAYGGNLFADGGDKTGLANKTWMKLKNLFGQDTGLDVPVRGFSTMESVPSINFKMDPAPGAATVTGSTIKNTRKSVRPSTASAPAVSKPKGRYGLLNPDYSTYDMRPTGTASAPAAASATQQQPAAAASAPAAQRQPAGRSAASAPAAASATQQQPAAAASAPAAQRQPAGRSAAMYDKLPSVSADFMPENKVATGPDRTFIDNRPDTGPTDEQRRNYNRIRLSTALKNAANDSLRYAGAVQSGLATLATALKKPDDTLQDSYNRMADNLPLPQVTFRPQFVNTRYTPQDAALALSRLQALSNASRRAAMNSGAGPSAGATLTALNAQYGDSAGNALAATRLANEQARNQNAQYINSIEQQNASGLMAAQQANAGYIMDRAKTAATYRDAALMAYDKERTARAAAMSQNSTQLANNLSKIGNENFIFNQIAANPYLLYAYLSNRNGDFAYRPNDINVKVEKEKG